MQIHSEYAEPGILTVLSANQNLGFRDGSCGWCSPYITCNNLVSTTGLYEIAAAHEKRSLIRMDSHTHRSSEDLLCSF